MTQGEDQEETENIEAFCENWTKVSHEYLNRFGYTCEACHVISLQLYHKQFFITNQNIIKICIQIYYDMTSLCISFWYLASVLFS